MSVTVVSNRHELVRIFARINGIPKEDLIAVIHGRDIAGLGFEVDEVVWVVGSPSGDVVGEVRRRAEAAGARISYAEPYDEIEGLAGLDTSKGRVTADSNDLVVKTGTLWPPAED